MIITCPQATPVPTVHFRPKILNNNAPEQSSENSKTSYHRYLGAGILVLARDSFCKLHIVNFQFKKKKSNYFFLFILILCTEPGRI